MIFQIQLKFDKKKLLKKGQLVCVLVFVSKNLFKRFENNSYTSLMITKKKFAQRGARTHDPEIKSLMLYRLS